MSDHEDNSSASSSSDASDVDNAEEQSNIMDIVANMAVLSKNDVSKIVNKKKAPKPKRLNTEKKKDNKKKCYRS